MVKTSYEHNARDTFSQVLNNERNLFIFLMYFIKYNAEALLRSYQSAYLNQ